jgi:hypothetical protein
MKHILPTVGKNFNNTKKSVKVKYLPFWYTLKCSDDGI